MPEQNYSLSNSDFFLLISHTHTHTLCLYNIFELKWMESSSSQNLFFSDNLLGWWLKPVIACSSIFIGVRDEGYIQRPWSSGDVRRLPMSRPGPSRNQQLFPGEVSILFSEYASFWQAMQSFLSCVKVVRIWKFCQAMQVLQSVLPGYAFRLYIHEHVARCSVVM